MSKIEQLKTYGRKDLSKQAQRLQQLQQEFTSRAVQVELLSCPGS